MNTWTATRITGLKGVRRITCLTAADYSGARLADAAGIEMLLVGDSLAMTVLGYETTLPVTMAEMLHHAAAVVRGAANALVVADMPFMSYQVSIAQGLRNAGRFIQRAGAGAVKIEGGALRVPLVRELVGNGIPVLGHIGLTPQSVRQLGGFKVQGRDNGQAEALIEDARALEEAGAFAIVLECMPPALAGRVTAAVGIPTIGIGAGSQCDGQVLVLHDMLGLSGDFRPRFVKRYAELGPVIQSAIEQYRREVEDGTFPGPEHAYAD